MRAIQDKIIVRRAAAETQIGRFVLANQSEPDRGEVIAVGPGTINPKTGTIVPNPVKVGERIIFAQGAGQRLEQGGREYVVLTPDAVIAVDDEPHPIEKWFEAALDKAYGPWPESYGGTE